MLPALGFHLYDGIMQSLIHVELLFPYAIPPLLSLLTSLFLASLTIQAGRTLTRFWSLWLC
ncbi:MAG: hypothetical protein HQM12_05320 [SAR324 cluster bacterium]|nr:hypothetical protein [SAR324 cluster bacterium]